MQHVSQLQDFQAGVWSRAPSPSWLQMADSCENRDIHSPAEQQTQCQELESSPRVSLIISNTTGRKKLLNYRKMFHFFFPFGSPLKFPAWHLHAQSLSDCRAAFQGQQEPFLLQLGSSSSLPRADGGHSKAKCFRWKESRAGLFSLEGRSHCSKTSW